MVQIFKIRMYEKVPKFIITLVIESLGLLVPVWYCCMVFSFITSVT